jgi:hypothetical protein
MLTNIFGTPELTCFLSQFIFKDGKHDGVTVQTQTQTQTQTQSKAHDGTTVERGRGGGGGGGGGAGSAVTANVIEGVSVGGGIGQPWHQDTFYFGMSKSNRMKLNQIKSN